MTTGNVMTDMGPDKWEVRRFHDAGVSVAVCRRKAWSLIIRGNLARGWHFTLLKYEDDVETYREEKFFRWIPVEWVVAVTVTP